MTQTAILHMGYNKKSYGRTIGRQGKQMDSLKCEAFLLAAEKGSLTKAAKILGYTQSGITRMIHSLEQETGFALLVRTPHGVRLTADGEAMLPALRNVVRAEKQAVNRGAEIRGIIQGTLHIGSYYSISAAWMPKILRQFRRDFPNVEIHLHEGTNIEISRWLNERSIDCCLSARPTKGTVCDWIPLYTDELCVWLPENHPAAGQTDFPIENLQQAPFIITLPQHDTDIDRFLEKEHIEVDIQFTTADPYTTYCMVEEGLGLSLNNRLTTKNWSGNVVILPFRPARNIELGLAVPCRKDMSPAARKFAEYAVRVVKAETERP